MPNSTITWSHAFLDSFETGDTISVDTTGASMVVVIHNGSNFITATLSGNSADVLNADAPAVDNFWQFTVYGAPTQGTSESFTFTKSSGDSYIFIVCLSDTVTTGSSLSDFFLETESENDGAQTVWDYDRVAAAADELVVGCFAQQGSTLTGITDGTEEVPEYSFDASADNMRIGYKVSTAAQTVTVEVTASASTNAYHAGFVPKYQASVTNLSMGGIILNP